MQNLLKCFISGIIILLERPFRVGDVLEIDGRRGTVTTIGIRSSVLMLWDRTVHLDTVSPLRVQVMPVEQEGPSVRLPI